MRSEVKQERTDWLWSRDRPHSPVYTSTLWFYFRPVVLLLSIVELEHAGGVETQKTCVHEKSHQGGFFYCIMPKGMMGAHTVWSFTDDGMLHLFSLHVTTHYLQLLSMRDI